MNRTSRTRTITMGLQLLLLAFPAAALPQSPCGDFVAQLSRGIRNLEYVECRQRTDLEGEPWEASYRVKGIHAAEVEAALARDFGVKQLSRTCCVWESMQNSYVDKRGRSFVISVSTEETTIDDRARWKEIPFFHVEVDYYTSAP